MSVTLRHREALVHVEQLTTGKDRIPVERLNQGSSMPRSTWETSYPLGLVEQIMNVKGPAYLFGEIMRDEDASPSCYVRSSNLKSRAMLSTDFYAH